MSKLKDWTPRARPGEWPLPGDRVVLEPLDWDEHGPGLFKAVAHKSVADIWTYMPLGPFEDLADFTSQFGAAAKAFDWQTMVIRRVNGGKVLGMSSYMRLRQAHGSAEIGAVAFGSALKRTPEASEAMYLMAEHVFEELGYRRYEWKCHNENAASKRAATRIGFKFEGIFRNDMVLRGKNRDTAWYAMTDEDWPVIRSAFRAWLQPRNFDAQGGQKQALESFRS